MSCHWVRCLGCVLLLGVVSGCGPSDGEIEAAVKSYYASNYEFHHRGLPVPDFHPLPVGINGQSQATEVHVKKRGEPFTPNELQRPFGASSKGYPVRVLVKGTSRSRQGSDQHFEGEADFVLYYLPPNKSKVDPGPGTWVVYQGVF